MNKNQPIRIAHVVGKMVGGGVEAFLMNYYKNIDKTIVQFDFIVDEDSTKIPQEDIEKMGGRVIKVPPYQDLFNYIKELKKVFKNNNYLIVHSHINTLSVIPLYCAWKLRIPIRIAHSHATSSKKEWKRNLIKTLLKPFSKVFATNYFACSEYAGRWLFGDKTFDNNNVYILNNAVDLDKFKYSIKKRNIVRKELQIKDDCIVIGHVGRLMETKNHRFLLDLFYELEKILLGKTKLLIVGQGPLEKILKEKVQNLDLEDKVMFVGQKDDIDEYYQAFDIIIFPSFYEGFGNVLLEAQISNLPCVVSDGIPLKTKIIEDFCFISLDESKQVWIDKCLQFIKNNKRESKVDLFFDKGFEIKTEAKKMEKIYIDLVYGENNAENKRFNGNI